MPGLDYSQIPAEKVSEMCSRSLYTVDGLWFTVVEQKYGLDVALEFDTEVWRRFGPVHARRLLKTYGIRKDSPIQTVISMLQVDPMLIVYKPEVVALTDSKAVFQCANCPPQKARIRDGRGEFPCKPAGVAFFASYAEAIDPRIKVSCLACPPDTHPAEYWCKWQIEV